jgi:Na+/proline symporter
MLAAWVAFSGYVAVALALGWAAYRRRDRGTAYWTAGRELGAASVGLSISAGFLSISWSCVYAVQLFYWYGAGALWLITVPWLLALGGIYLLSQRYHALPSFSQPEMVGRRFGRAARRLVALALLFVFLVWGGAEIYVAANLLGPGLGVSTGFMIVLISVVVAIYSTMGGFRAVVSTDKLQYGVVVLYIVAMGWLAWIGLRQAGLQLVESAAAPVAGNPALAVLAGRLGAKSGEPWSSLLAPGLGIIVLTFAAYLPGWLFETDLWLRVQAARDRTAARRGVLLAMLNAALFVGLLPLFIGVAALAVFPADGGFPPELGNEGDAIFVALVQRFAPAWLGAFVAVGLTAAAMSTIDTCANVMALSLAYDLAGVHERPHGERLSQLATAGSVALAMVFAFNTDSLWDIFYLSSGVLTTTVAFPVAAVFLPWATAAMVTASSAAGLVTTIAAYFLESRGWLAALEPAWLADSGLGYILWGMGAAVLAAAAAGSRTEQRE